MAQSIFCEIDGYPCVDAKKALEEFNRIGKDPSIFQDKANTYKCPSGHEVGRCYLLLLKKDLDKLDLEAKHSVEFGQFEEAEPSSNVIRSLTFVKAVNLTPSRPDDEDSLYLVELGDRRLLLDNIPLDLQVNVKGPSGSYYDTEKSWQDLVDLIWNRLNIPGSSLLPVIPTSVPNNIIFSGESAWMALRAILDKLYYIVVYNPISDKFSIINYTVDDPIIQGYLTIYGSREIDSADPVESLIAHLPQKTRVYYSIINEAYGTENTVIPDDTNWINVHNSYTFVDVPLNILGEPGTFHYVWDDMLAVYNTTEGRVVNLEDLVNRANEISRDFKGQDQVSGKRFLKEYHGILPFYPCNIIKQVTYSVDSRGARTEILRTRGETANSPKGCCDTVDTLNKIDIGQKTTPLYHPQIQLIQITAGTADFNGVYNAECDVLDDNLEVLYTTNCYAFKLDCDFVDLEEGSYYWGKVNGMYLDLPLFIILDKGESFNKSLDLYLYDYYFKNNTAGDSYTDSVVKMLKLLETFNAYAKYGYDDNYQYNYRLLYQELYDQNAVWVELYRNLQRQVSDINKALDNIQTTVGKTDCCNDLRKNLIQYRDITSNIIQTIQKRLNVNVNLYKRLGIISIGVNTTTIGETELTRTGFKEVGTIEAGNISNPMLEAGGPPFVVQQTFVKDPILAVLEQGTTGITIEFGKLPTIQDSGIFVPVITIGSPIVPVINNNTVTITVPTLNIISTIIYQIVQNNPNLQELIGIPSLNGYLTIGPFANDDSYVMKFGEALTIDPTGGVLRNDIDINSLSLIAVLVQNPVFGEVLLNADGSFRYKPLSIPSSGFDKFTYKAYNGFNYSNNATVTIFINDTTPLANEDFYLVKKNSVNNLSSVLDNDGDPNGFSLTAVLNTNPAKGVLQYFNDNGTFGYAPNLDYVGLDSFTYHCRNTVGINSAITTVNIMVIDPAQLPTNSLLSSIVNNVNTSALNVSNIVNNYIKQLQEDIIAISNISNPTTSTLEYLTYIKNLKDLLSSISITPTTIPTTTNSVVGYISTILSSTIVPIGIVLPVNNMFMQGYVYSTTIPENNLTATIVSNNPNFVPYGYVYSSQTANYGDAVISDTNAVPTYLYTESQGDDFIARIVKFSPAFIPPTKDTTIEYVYSEPVDNVKSYVYYERQ